MAEINVTPMVDVMLVLLVIFMVTAPLLVAGVRADLPRNVTEISSRSFTIRSVTLAKDRQFRERHGQPLWASTRRRWSLCERTGRPLTARCSNWVERAEAAAIEASVAQFEPRREPDKRDKAVGAEAIQERLAFSERGTSAKTWELQPANCAASLAADAGDEQQSKCSGSTASPSLVPLPGRTLFGALSAKR